MIHVKVPTSVSPGSAVLVPLHLVRVIVVQLDITVIPHMDKTSVNLIVRRILTTNLGRPVTKPLDSYLLAHAVTIVVAVLQAEVKPYMLNVWKAFALHVKIQQQLRALKDFFVIVQLEIAMLLNVSW